MPGNPLTDPNWPAQLADQVERWVGWVRDTATVRVVTIVRALVFGTVIGVASVATFTLLVIVFTKLLQRLVNIGGWIDADSSVWVSYLVSAAVLFVAGVLCMRQRHPSDTDRPA
jgi:hypothetical protein